MKVLRSLGVDCFVLHGGATKLQSYVPAWAYAFYQILLIQPSSAVAEQVFSLLANSFGANQDLVLQDYTNSSPMLQYNGR